MNLKTNKDPFFSFLNLVFDRTLVTNFLSLSTIQGINFLIPLLVYPFIIRVVSLEKFGTLSVAQALVSLLVVMTDFGFNLTATRRVSLARNDPAKLSQIFSQVLAAKVVLSLIAFSLLVLVTFIIPGFAREQELILWSFIIVIGQAFFPGWVFQGLEKMQWIAILQLAAKLIFAAGIFVFIEMEENYILVNPILGTAQVIMAIIAIAIIGIKFGIIFQFKEVTNFTLPLKRGWPIFSANLAGYLSTNSFLIILSFLSTPVVIGYFSLAEKVYLAARSLPVILHQIIYPRVCLIAQNSYTQVYSFFRGFVKLIWVSLVPFSVLIFILAPQIVFFFTGEILSEAITMIRIVAFTPLVAALNIPACQTLLAFNWNKSYHLAAWLGAVLSLILTIALTWFYSGIGTTIAVLLSELSITVIFYTVANLWHQRNLFYLFYPGSHNFILKHE